MEQPKRKPLSGLNEALKRIRQRKADPELVERINELVRRVEEMEKRRREEASRENRRTVRSPNRE